jgi:hypothetical protein
MKTLVASTLALAAMTSMALAGAPATHQATVAGKTAKGPVPLTTAQMDQVSAGFEFNVGILGFGLGSCGSRCGATGVGISVVINPDNDL